MTARESWPLWVCVDCYLVHAGYKVSELASAPDREPLALIGDHDALSMGLTRDGHAPDCPAWDINDWTGLDCDCERDPFSWSPCEGCGSRLGGERYAVTLWAAGA